MYIYIDRYRYGIWSEVHLVFVCSSFSLSFYLLSCFFFMIVDVDVDVDVAKDEDEDEDEDGDAKMIP